MSKVRVGTHQQSDGRTQGDEVLPGDFYFLYETRSQIEIGASQGSESG